MDPTAPAWQPAASSNTTTDPICQPPPAVPTAEAMDVDAVDEGAAPEQTGAEAQGAPAVFSQAERCVGGGWRRPTLSVCNSQ